VYPDDAGGLWFDHIVTVTVDVGLRTAELKQAEDKAKLLGTEHYHHRRQGEFVSDYIFPTIKAMADLIQRYPDQAHRIRRRGR